ncbi:MAG: hypothetical protein DHS20C06_01100 [Hyphobacterium sp.]|nr:MAG: hypothetical protein DHS20C06_01100 [Hyphobacterium sp.]
MGEAAGFDFKTLSEHLHSDADAILVIWAAPAAHLFAACLMDGMDSDDALQWVESRATEILNLFRRARRQVLILPADASWLSVAKIAKSTRDYFDRRIQPTFRIGADFMPQLDPSTVLHRLVGATIIDLHPNLNRLDQELRASMGQASLEPDLKKREINMALSELVNFSRAIPSQGQVPGIDEGPQSVLDVQRSLVAEIQDALIICQEELAWYHKLAASKKGGLEQRRIERELLAIKEERDVLRTLRSDLERQLEWARNDVEQLRHALDATRNSTSWKLTAPFRMLRGDGVSKKRNEPQESPAPEKGKA